ncbi:MAG: hypothetical protein HYZ73_09360 [Elusimicrobia bacterium]|nr:hypothetical protein [Elusimicrobiota bacterium]
MKRSLSVSPSIPRLRPSTSLRAGGGLVYGLCLLLLGGGCSQPKPAEPSNTRTVRRATPPPLISIPKPTEVRYDYHGDSRRDPFIPLTGRVAGSGRGELVVPQLGALTLKGIVGDKHKRVALLVGGGGVFVLKDGKLYDNRNRLIHGISGTVKERSVVLTGPDRTVKELAFRQ